MNQPRTTTIDAAILYIRAGRAVVPVPGGRKGPILSRWQKLRISEACVTDYFTDVQNIGIILGEPSDGLTDTDLDCVEARELADQFLPPTSAVTGRKSSPRSHRWYNSPGSVTRQFKDPKTGEMLVEIRSTGVQTLVGSSIHPESGEPYDMLEGEPAAVRPEELLACVQRLADEIVRRRYPDEFPDGLPRTPPPITRISRLGQSPAETDEDALRRAVAYLDAIPGAVSGQGGHSQTYAAATAMVHGFDLDPAVAFNLMMNHYNPRCDPPWSEHEMRHKINDAATKPHNRERGWLRDKGTTDDSDVDLSGLSMRPTPPGAGPSVDEAAPKPQPGAAKHSSDPGPFPEDLLDVPGFIGEVIAYNLRTATKPQPVLALAGAIALQAVLAGRKVRDERGNRTNIYCVGLAGSGAGKDHARKVNKNVLFMAGLDALDGCEDLASDAGLISAVEQEPAILFQMDEFGRFLRTIADPRKCPHLFNVVSALMKLYSSADTVFKGKAYANASMNKCIDQPCVSLHGTTVPQHFWAALTPESLADGFVARLSIFQGAGSVRRQRTPAEAVPASILTTARWWGNFSPGGNLQREHPQPVVVPATEEANAVFDELAETVDAESRHGEIAAAVWARCEEKACRLALAYACSKNRENPVIDGDAATWACRLSVYMTQLVMFKADDWVAENVFDSQQKRVLRIIRDAGGSMTRSALCRKTQYLNRRERSELIANLVETGALVESATPTQTKHVLTYTLREAADVQ